jgi:hypothetical protein
MPFSKSKLSWSIAAALILPAPALAGGLYHHGHEARTIEPAKTQFVHEPAVIGTRVQRIETAPGYWTATKLPAQNGYVDRSVVVKPASVTYKVLPATYRTEHRTVVVKPASWRYEMRPDRHGRMVRCKVEVPAVTKTVSQTVMATPSHMVASTTPAVYKTVRVPLQIAPSKVVYQYTPPRVDYVAHAYTLKDATVRVVHTPAHAHRPLRMGADPLARAAPAHDNRR